MIYFLYYLLYNLEKYKLLGGEFMKYNTEISEKYYKLKYFYHIDSHTIVNKLKEKLSSSFDTTQTFQTIFNEMIPACKLFSEYILSNDYLPSTSFFNDYYPKDIVRAQASTLVFLCQASLFHHCILHGFQNQLSTAILRNDKVKVKFNHNPNSIALTGANDRDIEYGFFASLNRQKKCKENKDPAIYQKYKSTYYKRFAKNRTGYSHYLLIENSYNSYTGKLAVPVYESTPFLFLFKSTNTVPLDKALHSSSKRNLINRYLLLAKESEEWKNTHFEHFFDDCSEHNDCSKCKHKSECNHCDSVLFDMVLESCYGFKLLNNLEIFLSQIQNTDSSAHALESQALIEIISNYIFTLPITYNRSIFLDYTCYAALNSRNLQDVPYPPQPFSSLGERFSSVEQSTDKFATDATQCISNFFRMLNYCTIPLLEDLWDVITAELYDTIPLDYSCYVQFIEKYYKQITADYSSIFAKDIPFAKIWNDVFKFERFSFSAKYSKIFSHLSLEKTPNIYLPNLPYQRNILGMLSFLVRCKCNSGNHPLHSIDEIILAQSSETESTCSYKKEYELFQKQYLNNVFDFLEQHNPNVPF